MDPDPGKLKLALNNEYNYSIYVLKIVESVYDGLHALI